ncbi:hypothetical protein EWM64_g3617 [Hericium alpestre]|uniref:NAD(P)-binding protein n=1 Tax=Hericium alpestre TaxID=135208 RepID=A0A4Z0A1Q3_9AGAM|nr:hypothetical protein EWM64_g3617 [Hericium alpestre]
MGSQWSVIAQMFPPSPKWGVRDMPDLAGKVIIVTGAAGVGKETAKALLEHNAKVYIASRNKAKTSATIEELKRETGKEADFLQLDLADLSLVRKAADEFLSEHAVMACPLEELTAQGYDMQFGTNVLGHFHFTELPTPALLAVSASGNDPREKARVITTASSAVYLLGLITYETLKPCPLRNKVSTYDLYNQTKFANLVLANELARRHDDRIVSISVNPGNLRTELQRYLTGPRKWVIDRILYPPSYGALNQL